MIYESRFNRLWEQWRQEAETEAVREDDHRFHRLHR